MSSQLVLFACTHDKGRSQIANAFFNLLADPENPRSISATQGRTVAVLQVSGGSQSFNAVNQLRVLGRWMRMFTIPNQSSVPKAFEQFDAEGRMKPSSYRDRVVDVMEELFRFTVLLRDNVEVLDTRYSEEKEKRAQGALKPALGVGPRSSVESLRPFGPSPVFPQEDENE